MSFNILSWAEWKYGINNKRRSMMLKVLSKHSINDPHARALMAKQIDEQSPTLHSFIGFLRKIHRNLDKLDKEDKNHIIETIQDKIDKSLLEIEGYIRQKDHHRFKNNLDVIKKHIKTLVNAMYLEYNMELEKDMLVIKEKNFFFFNIITIAIEYIDTIYPMPEIFKINISRSKSQSKTTSQKAEGIKKKKRQTRRKDNRKKHRVSRIHKP